MTKYRQTFTVEVANGNVPAYELSLLLKLRGLPSFADAGSSESGNGEVSISWSDFEPIIEVPQNFAAVVVDPEGGRWVRFASHWEYEDDGDARFEDSEMAEQLSKHGWKILTNGVQA